MRLQLIKTDHTAGVSMVMGISCGFKDYGKNLDLRGDRAEGSVPSLGVSVAEKY